MLVKVKFETSSKLFTFRSDIKVEIGDFVVVDTTGFKMLTQVVQVEDHDNPNHKSIERIATPADINVALDEKRNKSIYDLARTESNRLKLKMSILSVNISPDKRTVRINYKASDLVKFNELVGSLSAKLKRKILMYHVPARDVASTIDSYGVCGQPLCCNNYLKKFPPVKTSAIKQQGVTLNKDNNEGICGPFKCCYNFEADMYATELKKHPKIGTIVTFEGNNYKLIDVNIISKTGHIIDRDGNGKVVDLDDIKRSKNK